VVSAPEDTIQALKFNPGGGVNEPTLLAAGSWDNLVTVAIVDQLSSVFWSGASLASQREWTDGAKSATERTRARARFGLVRCTSNVRQ
jgi:hypothetical protein